MTLDEVGRAAAEAADAAVMVMAHLDRLGVRIAGGFPVSAKIERIVDRLHSEKLL